MAHTHRLTQRPTLPNRDLIALLDTERRADVCSEVGVTFLVTGVLGDEVEVFTADNQGACSLLVSNAFQVLELSPCRAFFSRNLLWLENLTYGASWWT